MEAGQFSEEDSDNKCNLISSYFKYVKVNACLSLPVFDVIFTLFKKKEKKKKLLMCCQTGEVGFLICMSLRCSALCSLGHWQPGVVVKTQTTLTRFYTKKIQVRISSIHTAVCCLGAGIPGMAR